MHRLQHFAVGLTKPSTSNGVLNKILIYKIAFPSCHLSLFENESLCKTSHIEVSLICMKMTSGRNSFSYEWFRRKIRFKTEAKDHSDIRSIAILARLLLVKPINVFELHRVLFLLLSFL